MIAFKLTALVIGVMTGGYYMLPMQTKTMYTAPEHIETRIEAINVIPSPTAPTVNRIEPVGINQDKTYEQCMKEAFESIYEEVNKRLAEDTDKFS